MREVKAPQLYDKIAGPRKLFLAGSIEMGTAEDWQKKVVDALNDVDVLVLNPRRSSWDPKWHQSGDNPLFREQVEWELQGLEDADLVLVYFHPMTKAPITLLELGLFGGKNPEKLIVCCPEGYWRKGNVDIVCERYGIMHTNNLDTLVEMVRARFNASNKTGGK